MPIYQTKVRCNNQTFNFDLECDSVDDVKALCSELLVGTILEIKKYIKFTKLSKIKKDFTNSKYISIKIHFDNNTSTLIKIPSLKKEKSIQDITTFIRSIYKNVSSVKVNYS